MDKGKQGVVTAATVALAIVPAVGLAAMGAAGEDHVALVAASATARGLP